MNLPTLRQCLADLTADEVVRRDAARLALWREDEAIVAPLIDEFYAGVSRETGTALLEVIGQIGGYEAAALFRELLVDPGAEAAWRAVAERWLRHDGLLP